MLINLDRLKSEDINSRVHKVRAVIFADKTHIYVTNMDSSYNIPGGRVEAGEKLEDALVRELKEELGIRVFKKEIKYIGNYVFWHKDFPGEKGAVNRENKIDLFYVSSPKEVYLERVKLTNYEKHYHFRLMKCTYEEIDALLKEKNENVYKKFTDVELKTLIENFRKEEKIC